MKADRFLPKTGRARVLQCAIDCIEITQDSTKYIALIDNCGAILTWSEIQGILQAIEPFYNHFSDEQIELHNKNRYNIPNPQKHEKEKEKNTTGYVYLLKAGKFYKIGLTKTLDERIKQLSTIPPFDLELIHAIASYDMYTLETDLHEKFSAKRKRGEWFELTQADVDFIRSL